MNIIPLRVIKILSYTSVSQQTVKEKSKILHCHHYQSAITCEQTHGHDFVSYKYYDQLFFSNMYLQI